MKKANSAGSMEGFYPRPEPRKSSLMKRNTSASSMLLDSTDLSTKSGLSSANATTNNGVGNGTTGASGGGGSGLKRNSSSTVSFSKLEIREYDICLSTHPDCSIGPPIQLGWNYGETKAVSVDEYELLHCDRNRRTGRELLLTSPERRDLLLKEGGYTKQELQWAWQEVERVKLERAAANASSMHMRGRSTSPKARHHRQRHLNSSRSSNNNSGSNNVGDWVGQLLNWIR
jgi:hypothetical protein